MTASDNNALGEIFLNPMETRNCGVCCNIQTQRVARDYRNIYVYSNCNSHGSSAVDRLVLHQLRQNLGAWLRLADPLLRPGPGLPIRQLQCEGLVRGVYVLAEMWRPEVVVVYLLSGDWMGVVEGDYTRVRLVRVSQSEELLGILRGESRRSVKGNW